jgi:uncharacterized membrane protein YesL
MYHFVANGVYRFCEWVTRLAYLNVLWISFSLLGLIVLGAGPSTVAMYTVTRKWLTGNLDIPIFKTFFNTYKKEFQRGNLLGIILFCILAVFWIDFKIFAVMDAEFSVVTILLSSLSLVFFVLLLFIFPVYVHFNIKLSEVFKFSVLIGFSKPFYSLMMIAGSFGALFISLLHVTVILFFSGSLFSLIMSAIALRAFKSLERSQADEQAA